jgi:hypothetical protein
MSGEKRHKLVKKTGETFMVVVFSPRGHSVLRYDMGSFNPRHSTKTEIFIG